MRPTWLYAFVVGWIFSCPFVCALGHVSKAEVLANLQSQQGSHVLHRGSANGSIRFRATTNLSHASIRLNENSSQTSARLLVADHVVINTSLNTSHNPSNFGEGTVPPGINADEPDYSPPPLKNRIDVLEHAFSSLLSRQKSLEKEVLGKTEAHTPIQRDHTTVELHEPRRHHPIGLGRLTLSPNGDQETGFPPRSFATSVATSPPASATDVTKRSIFRRETIRHDASSSNIGSLLNEQLLNLELQKDSVRTAAMPTVVDTTTAVPPATTVPVVLPQVPAAVPPTMPPAMPPAMQPKAATAKMPGEFIAKGVAYLGFVLILIICCVVAFMSRPNPIRRQRPSSYQPRPPARASVRTSTTGTMTGHEPLKAQDPPMAHRVSSRESVRRGRSPSRRSSGQARSPSDSLSGPSTANESADPPMSAYLQRRALQSKARRSQAQPPASEAAPPQKPRDAA